MYTKRASIFELIFDVLWHITHCNAAPVIVYDDEQCYYFLSYDTIVGSTKSSTPWQGNYPGMQLSLLQNNIASKRFIDYLFDYDEVQF